MGMAGLLKLESKGGIYHVSNQSLADALHLGNLFEVSREVAAWIRNPEPRLCKKLQIIPNPKT